MKKKSFVRHAAWLLGLQVLVVSALLVLFVAFSWNSAKNTLESSNHNLMQLYSKELENKIEHAQNMLKQILYDSSDYILLQIQPQQYLGSDSRQHGLFYGNIGFIFYCDLYYGLLQPP